MRRPGRPKDWCAQSVGEKHSSAGALLVEISSPAMIASLPAAAASDGTRPEHRWQLFAPRPNSQSFKLFGARPSVSFRPLLLRLPLDRIRRALSYVDANKIVVAPDCGLKYLPREVLRHIWTLYRNLLYRLRSKTSGYSSQP